MSCLKHRPITPIKATITISKQLLTESKKKMLTESISIASIVNSSPPSATHKHQWTKSAFVQIMACRLFSTKPLSNWCWVIVKWTLRNKRHWKFNQNMKIFINEIHSKLLSVTWWPFCPGGDDLIEFSRTSNDVRAWICNYIHTEGWYVNTNSYPILTHWGRVTHICVSKLTIIGSDNGLSPGRRQAIILNQCWYIVNWVLRNKLQWNFNRNS